MSADSTRRPAPASTTGFTRPVIGIVGRALLAVPVLLSFGCSKPLTEDECLRLLDRYTDKIVDQARPSSSSGERADLQAQARKKAALDPEFALCSERVSRRQFECAMAAPNADAMERCLL